LPRHRRLHPHVAGFQANPFVFSHPPVVVCTTRTVALQCPKGPTDDRTPSQTGSRRNSQPYPVGDRHRPPQRLLRAGRARRAEAGRRAQGPVRMKLSDKDKIIQDLISHADAFVARSLRAHTGYFPNDSAGNEASEYYKWSQRAFELIRKLEETTSKPSASP